MATKLHAFIERLKTEKIPYQLNHVREDAVMVQVATPGERWEIEFFEDGSVEVERFRSTGKLENESSLEEFFANMSADAAD